MARTRGSCTNRPGGPYCPWDLFLPRLISLPNLVNGHTRAVGPQGSDSPPPRVVLPRVGAEHLNVIYAVKGRGIIYRTARHASLHLAYRFVLVLLHPRAHLAQ